MKLSKLQLRAIIKESLNEDVTTNIRPVFKHSDDLIDSLEMNLSQTGQWSRAHTSDLVAYKRLVSKAFDDLIVSLSKI